MSNCVNRWLEQCDEGFANRFNVFMCDIDHLQDARWNVDEYEDIRITHWRDTGAWFVLSVIQRRSSTLLDKRIFSVSKNLPNDS